MIVVIIIIDWSIITILLGSFLQALLLERWFEHLWGFPIGYSSARRWNFLSMAHVFEQIFDGVAQSKCWLLVQEAFVAIHIHILWVVPVPRSMFSAVERAWYVAFSNNRPRKSIPLVDLVLSLLRPLVYTSPPALDPNVSRRTIHTQLDIIFHRAILQLHWQPRFDLAL